MAVPRSMPLIKPGWSGIPNSPGPPEYSRLARNPIRRLSLKTNTPRAGEEVVGQRFTFAFSQFPGFELLRYAFERQLVTQRHHRERFDCFGDAEQCARLVTPEPRHLMRHQPERRRLQAKADCGRAGIVR